MNLDTLQKIKLTTITDAQLVGILEVAITIIKSNIHLSRKSTNSTFHTFLNEGLCFIIKKRIPYCDSWTGDYVMALLGKYARKLEMKVRKKAYWFIDGKNAFDIGNIDLWYADRLAFLNKIIELYS